MNRVLIILTCAFLYGCGNKENKIIYSEIVSITTPEEVVFRKGEVSEVMVNAEAKDKLVSYFKENGIYYRLDDNYPNEVIWVPESKKHQTEIIRKAFGVPLNQIQKIFRNENNYKKYQSILKNYSIKYLAKPHEDYFVVIWTPASKDLENKISEEYKN